MACGCCGNAITNEGSTCIAYACNFLILGVCEGSHCPEGVSKGYIMLLVGCVLGAPGFPDRCTLTAGHLLEGLPALEGPDAPRIPALHSTRCARDAPESSHVLSSRDSWEVWPNEDWQEQSYRQCSQHLVRQKEGLCSGPHPMLSKG